MSAREFLTSATIALAMMALAALIEVALPLFTRTPAQRGRSATNLGLTALTLSLQLGADLGCGRHRARPVAARSPAS